VGLEALGQRLSHFSGSQNPDALYRCHRLAFLMHSWRASRGVLVPAQEVNRYVWLLADDPAVVRHRRNVEQLAGVELGHPPVVEGHHGDACENDPHVLDGAAGCVDARSHMLGPFPSRLVARASDREPAQSHDLELPLLHDAHFVRGLESFEDHVDHHSGIRFHRFRSNFTYRDAAVESTTTISRRIFHKRCSGSAINTYRPYLVFAADASLKLSSNVP